MAAGLAERLYASNPAAGPVTICDLDGKPRWQPLWDGNPAIGVTLEGPRVTAGGGCLPYLVYPKQPGRLTFSPTYRAHECRGHLYLTKAEMTQAKHIVSGRAPFVLLEPTPADRKNANRHWPHAAWQQLADLLIVAGVSVYQFDHPAAVWLTDVGRLPSPTFRDACALMRHAALVIALEGGIPFATAALGVPTVVLWGGCISAETLAFPEHINLVDLQHNGCGRLKPCVECAAAWQRLTPDTVAAAALTALADSATPRKRVAI